MKFTVFGASGFIGSNLVARLTEAGYEVEAPSKGVIPSPKVNLGHVVYAIGLTGDFRTRPFDTVDAHVTYLRDLLATARFESFLYLSSTRIYGAAQDFVSESDSINLMVKPDSLYDLSKMLGEALCLSCGRDGMRIARLANVYGDGQSENTFLGSILSQISRGKTVVIDESPDSGKDYVSIEDTVEMLLHIATQGREQIYNIASGAITTHDMIAGLLNTHCDGLVSFRTGAKKRRLPLISIERIKAECRVNPRSLIDDLPGLLRRKM